MGRCEVSLGVVFPGQGSQRVGMGRDWLTHPAAKAVFDEADRALGFSISNLCFDGPEDELKLTANQQPAILTVSYAIYQTIRDTLPPVACLAGHSLGEYTALVAGGALSFADAVRTVHERGKLMQVAVPAGQGAMAAVIGLDAVKIAEINREVTAALDAELDCANFNSPDQVVISGSAIAVAKAIPLYTTAGAKRVVELPVSAPFHSGLMVPAADGLKPRLDELAFKAPKPPVVANLTVQDYPEDCGEYAKILHAQIFNPVRWQETMLLFAARGVTAVLEVGPGKVLRTLLPKITKDIKGYNIELESEREALAQWLAGLAAEGAGA
jgi:[acyl-carrier-protein] S-malonyltransferase